MSFAETIIGGILVAIFTGLLGLLIGGKNKVTTKDLEDHRKDMNPHTNCPVHTTEIVHIKATLARIESKVDTLVEAK